MIYKTLRDNVLPNVLAFLEEKERLAAELIVEEAPKRATRSYQRESEQEPEKKDSDGEPAGKGRKASRKAKEKTRELQLIQEELDQLEDDEDQLLGRPKRHSKVDDWHFACICGVEEDNYDGIIFNILFKHLIHRRKTADLVYPLRYVVAHCLRCP